MTALTTTGAGIIEAIREGMRKPDALDLCETLASAATQLKFAADGCRLGYSGIPLAKEAIRRAEQAIAEYEEQG